LKFFGAGSTHTVAWVAVGQYFSAQSARRLLAADEQAVIRVADGRVKPAIVVVFGSPERWVMRDIASR